MDAASFLDSVRSAVLGVLFLANAMWMDDAPPCPASAQCPVACAEKCDRTQADKPTLVTVTVTRCDTPSACCQVACQAKPACGSEDCGAPSCCASDDTAACPSDSQCDSQCDSPCDACSTTQVAGHSVPDSSVLKLANWMGQWFSRGPKIRATIAVHSTVQGVVPELNLEAVVPCGHKICAGGKCYEVEEGEVAGRACDQIQGEGVDAAEGEDEEPIVEVPAAPPLPPSYQFTSMHSTSSGESESIPGVVLDALRESDVRLPASVLVSLLVTQAETNTRLEMTEAMMAERADVTEQMLSLVERNAHLQSQLAMMEARQHAADALASTLVERAEIAVQLASRGAMVVNASPCANECTSESKTGLQAIQEDLTNIRRQIALIKRQQPVPFAPSYVGSTQPEEATGSPWRTARISPYVPVSPKAVPSEVPTDSDPSTEWASPSIK